MPHHLKIIKAHGLSNAHRSEALSVRRSSSLHALTYTHKLQGLEQPSCMFLRQTV